jgi:isopentenyldiphosphate isomerase
MEEYFDIIDEQGAVIGQASRASCHGDPGLVHRVAHVLVVDRNDRIFLQKRSMRKDIEPGKWDTSVGGHLQVGESYDQAAVRELEEELGITGVTPQCLYTYRWSTSIESEDIRTYLVVWGGGDDCAFKLQAEEITDGRFWTRQEIQDNIGKGVFTPNFEQEFERYLRWRARERGRSESSQSET